MKVTDLGNSKYLIQRENDADHALLDAMDLGGSITWNMRRTTAINDAGKYENVSAVLSIGPPRSVGYSLSNGCGPSGNLDEAKTKYCVNCRHYLAFVKDENFFGDTDRCSHPAHRNCPVTGRIRIPNCLAQRSISGEGMCGPEGRLFDRKISADEGGAA